MQQPLLQALDQTRMSSLYLGLILSIVLMVLIILSVMLIHALLMISVETRTFELGPCVCGCKLVCRVLRAHRGVSYCPRFVVR